MVRQIKNKEKPVINLMTSFFVLIWKSKMCRTWMTQPASIHWINSSINVRVLWSVIQALYSPQALQILVWYSFLDTLRETRLAFWLYSQFVDCFSPVKMDHTLWRKMFPVFFLLFIFFFFEMTCYLSNWLIFQRRPLGVWNRGNINRVFLVG